MKKFRAYFLLIIIVASSAAALISFKPAYADTTDDMMAKAGAAWAALRVLRDHHVTDNGELPAEWVTSVGYVGTVGCFGGTISNYGAVGYLVAPSGDGYLTRDTGSWCFPRAGTEVKDVYTAIYSSLGLNPTTFVQALGFQLSPDGKYTGGSFSDSKLNSMLTKIWPASLGSPNIGGATPNWLKYLDLVAGSTKIGCTAAGLTQFPDTNGNVWLFNGSSSTRYKVVPTSPDGPFGFAVERSLSCPSVVSELGQNGLLANAYVTAKAKAAPSTPKTCEQQYARDATSLKACIDGFNNLSTPGYCTSKYPVTGTNDTTTAPQIAAQNACTYGHDTASGAAGVTRSSQNNQADPGKTTCAIDGIGWIVCPVMTFLSKVTDAAYGFLADNFLTVDTSLVSTTTSQSTSSNPIPSPIYLAWQTFRNLANIAFVIVFLIIIYSQITTAGINNYGIKKMLPRLIIAAILVNVSFYLCQIAVDISNLLGYGMKALFDSLGGSGITSNANNASALQAGGKVLTWASIVVGVLALTAGLALAISLPVLLAALLALVSIVFILLARKALIVLLIVVSPLAFVAYLLPNTEQWYKKWQKLFFSLLMLFPTIGVLFGASRLAANVIANSGAVSGGPNGPDYVLQATAMGIASIPLFFTYSLLKNALSATGAIGAKLSGLSSAANKNLSSKVKTTSRLGQGVSEAMNFRKQQRNINMAKNRGRGGRINAAFGKLGGDGYANRMKTQGAALEDKEAEEAVSNAVTQMSSDLGPAGILEMTKDANGDTIPDIKKGAAAELVQALESGDVAKTRAATKLLLGQGAPGKAALRAAMSNRRLEKSPTTDGYQKEINAANLKGSDNVLASSGYTLGKTVEELAGDTNTYNGLSDGELAGQNAGDIRRAVDLRAIDSTTAKRILENPSLQPSLTGAKRAALNRAFGGGGAGPTPPPTPSTPSGPPTPPSAPTTPGPSLNVPHGEEDDSAGVL